MPSSHLSSFIRSDLGRVGQFFLAHEGLGDGVDEASLTLRGSSTAHMLPDHVLQRTTDLCAARVYGSLVVLACVHMLRVTGAS